MAGARKGADLVAKWISLLFPFTDSEGKKHPAYGPCLRGLALLKVKKGHWSLTHMKSSARIVYIEGDYADVRRAATDIANLADWDEYETREQVMAVPGLAERVKAILLSAAGEDEREAGNA